MEHIKQSLNRTIDYSPSNNIKTIDYSNLTSKQADGLIENVTDLIDDPAYKPYFYKHLYRLMPSEFLRRADQAREARVTHHGRLFWKLLGE